MRVPDGFTINSDDNGVSLDHDACGCYLMCWKGTPFSLVDLVEMANAHECQSPSCAEGSQA